MAEKTGNGYIKKETTMIIALVAVVAGFLMGIVFSVFNSGSSNVQTAAPGPPPQAQNFSAQQASQILALEKEVAANPESVSAWTRLGHVYYDTNNFSKAIRAYEKSLELNPNNPDVLTDLGVMYRRNGQPEEALKRFDMAIQADPQHQQSRFNKGVVLNFDLNDKEGAKKAWEELIEINPMATLPNGQPVSEAIKTL
jgi:cytochrome c-type biogenesis protein CcmH/NrfG